VSEVFTSSGESSDITAGPSPRLQGLFLPGIDNPQFVDGFGIVTPWGGGSTARRYGDYGIIPDRETQLKDLASSLIPAEGGGISFGAEGPRGLQGLPGPQGLPGIITVMGLNLPQNSNFLAALPHNLDLINDLGTAANRLIYTNAYNTYTEIVWVERQPKGDANEDWYGLASDADGSHLIAGARPGRLWTSADSGANWTERRPGGDTNMNWSGVASDDDGSNLIAGNATIGRLWTSANSGANWTERQPAGDANKNWWGVASDSDGSHLIAGEFIGRLWTSANSGANWTERQPAGDFDENWEGVASDADGSHLIVGNDGGRLYTSANYGVNWTERQPAGAANKDWYSVASDDDGSHLIAGNSLRLYTSANYGVNWTERQPAGDVDKEWRRVASDSDGSHLVAGNSLRLYTSDDYGVTWTEQQPAGDADKDWHGVASDADGSNLIVGNDGGRLYTGVETTLYSEATWAESALTSAGRAILDDANAAAQATTLGLGTGDSPTWVGGTFTGTVETKGFIGNLRTKTSGYTATATDYTILCNASGGAFTITLPAAASHTGRIYYIKKIDSSANTVTVDGNSSETIDDGLTAVLTVQYESITIQSDGSEWWIL
jgi:hypothetical protein